MRTPIRARIASRNQRADAFPTAPTYAQTFFDRRAMNVLDLADLHSARQIMPKKVRSPQEKKGLSYERDRRNTYGENSKSSRKNIPRSKALDIRRKRHETKQALYSVLQARSQDQQVTAELAVLAVKPRRWEKQPDAPLGEYLTAKKKRSTAGRVRKVR